MQELVFSLGLKRHGDDRVSLQTAIAATAIAEIAIAAIAIAAIAIAAIAIALHCTVSERQYAEALMEAARIQPQEAAQRDRAGLLEEITRSVVRLHKEYIGQGPTKARTYIGEDVVVCVLQGGFSRAERTLLEHGRAGAVISQRQALDEALRQPLSDMIERLVERGVVGFTSAVQPDGELSTVVFLLQPARSAHGAASRLLTYA